MQYFTGTHHYFVPCIVYLLFAPVHNFRRHSKLLSGHKAKVIFNKAARVSLGGCYLFMVTEYYGVDRQGGVGQINFQFVVRMCGIGNALLYSISLCLILKFRQRQRSDVNRFVSVMVPHQQQSTASASASKMANLMLKSYAQVANIKYLKTKSQ